MKIGIIGGTFDPIHNGHLIIAEYARTHLKLDKVIFIPVGIAPHKDNNKITNAKSRVEMINLSIKSNPYFYQSLIEVKRDNVTYTVDTLTSLKEEYPENEFYFIMGGDSILEIESWKDHKKLMKICNFIVLDRDHITREDINLKVSELKLLYGMDTQVIRSPLIEISSTEIRNRIKKGLSIKYLVPESVENYIKDNELYLEDDLIE